MKEIKRIALMIVVFILLLGLAYPLAFTAIARLAGSKSDGEIRTLDGKPVGARNIGQEFTSNSYFHGRPSAAGSGYDAMQSGASNLGPSNPRLVALARARITRLLKENPQIKRADIPTELITASASGLDPDISKQAALLQAPRVAMATGLSQQSLKSMIDERLRGRFLWIFGEPSVNVLELNLAILEATKGEK